jgi:hypothetical protein
MLNINLCFTAGGGGVNSPLYGQKLASTASGTAIDLTNIVDLAAAGAMDLAKVKLVARVVKPILGSIQTAENANPFFKIILLDCATEGGTYVVAATFEAHDAARRVLVASTATGGIIIEGTLPRFLRRYLKGQVNCYTASGSYSTGGTGEIIVSIEDN